LGVPLQVCYRHAPSPLQLDKQSTFQACLHVNCDQRIYDPSKQLHSLRRTSRYGLLPFELDFQVAARHASATCSALAISSPPRSTRCAITRSRQRLVQTERPSPSTANVRRPFETALRLLRGRGASRGIIVAASMHLSKRGCKHGYYTIERQLTRKVKAGTRNKFRHGARSREKTPAGKTARKNAGAALCALLNAPLLKRPSSREGDVGSNVQRPTADGGLRG